MAEQRKGRIVRVTVDDLEVSELDVQFSIEKSLAAEPNTCELSIFNLTRDHQAQLEQLRPKKGDARGIPVRIEAGYETTGTSLIWLGDLRTAYTIKEGPSDRTVLSSGDGERAFQTSQIDQSLGPGTPPDVALRAIARAMGLGEGNITKAVASLTEEGKAALSAPLAEGIVFSGPAARQLHDWAASAGLSFSIQNGALQFVNRGKALSDTAILLDNTNGKNSGLLGTPTVDNEGILTARMLMTPDAYPGRLVVLKSAHIEGNFKIERTVIDGDNFGGPFEIGIEAPRY